jgi:hypothetical protein
MKIGENYGVEDAQVVRHNLMLLRDKLVKGNQHAWATHVSHAVILLTALCKEVWKDEFKTEKDLAEGLTHGAPPGAPEPKSC